jgi:hypothetical protein
MRDLPFTIDILGDPITIRYQQDGDPLAEGDLAAFDERTGTVIIREGETGPGLRVLLVHEFLHIVESSLIQQGLLRRRVPHDFITFGSSGLVLLLSEAGILDLPQDEVRKFYPTPEDDDDPS